VLLTIHGLDLLSRSPEAALSLRVKLEGPAQFVIVELGP
jgi:hypothetical protein